MNDLIFILFAAIGVVTATIGVGTGIGAAARHLVQLHADRVAERLARLER